MILKLGKLQLTRYSYKLFSNLTPPHNQTKERIQNQLKKTENEDHRKTSPQRLPGIFKIIDLKEEYPENTKSWTYEN